MRAWTVVRFIFGAIFGSKWGLGGLFVVVFEVLWRALSAWQTMDFLLQDHMMPLTDILNSFWGTLGLVVLGFLLMGKAVYDRWPESQPTELETQGRWRGQEALEAWRNQIQEWVLDKDKPLAKAQLDDPRRDLAATQTRALLRKLGPDQKREVLETMAYCNLINRSPTIVILNKADFSNANLTDLHLRDVWIGFASFKNADLSGATFSDFDTEVFRHRANEMGLSSEDIGYHVSDCMLWHNDFSGAILKDTRLGGCNLAGADFKGANLDGTDLRGAFLLGAKNLTQKQLNKAYGAYGQWRDETRSLPQGLEVPEAWGKPIREQREARERDRGVFQRLARFLNLRD